MLEDRVVSAGTYTATASIAPDSPWIMQMVAFRAAVGSAGPPDLVITNTHGDGFAHGKIGAVYTLTATNIGLGTSAGRVTVIDVLPSGLTATALGGSGWYCMLSTLTCTRNDTLASGASYPPIALTVNVAANAPLSVTNVATISGGAEANIANDSALDVTAIAAAFTSQSGALTP